MPDRVTIWFANAIALATLRRMSAANCLEVALTIDTYGDPEASRQLDHFIRHAEIEIAAVTLKQAQITRQACQDFDKGRHKAALNVGDCFAYVLARATGEPLLFRGNDFSNTAIVAVTR